MNLLKLTISCLLIFILSYSVSNAQDVILYGAVRDSCEDDIPFDGSLYIINPSTGQAQPVGGPIGFKGVSALAILNDSRLVATATDDNGDRRSILIEINPITGQGTLIGIIGDETVPGECGRVPGLTYDKATDTLYGVGIQCNSGSNSLLEINPDNAQATIIGPGTGFSGPGYGTAINNQGVIFSIPAPGTVGTLININPVTGIGALVALLNPNTRVNGLDFHPVTGVLFGSALRPEQELVNINTTDGSVTVIGDLPDCTDGIVFYIQPTNVPTLSQWGLIAVAAVLGIVGFMVIRRRKVTG